VLVRVDVIEELAWIVECLETLAFKTEKP